MEIHGFGGGQGSGFGAQARRPEMDRDKAPGNRGSNLLRRKIPFRANQDNDFPTGRILQRLLHPAEWQP